MKSNFLRSIFALAIACLAARPSRGEMFYGPTSTTNQFLIGANEAVLIDTIVGFDRHLEVSVNASNVIYLGQVDGDLDDRHACNTSPSAFAGPCKLDFTNAAAIRFTRSTNSSIGMLLWDGISTNASITVPEGKTIELFCPTAGGWSCEFSPVTLLARGLVYGPLVVMAGQRLEGPLTLRFDTSDLLAAHSRPAVIGSYRLIAVGLKHPSERPRR
jgi:hypothetical protein